jgi:hypothetical protein
MISFMSSFITILISFKLFSLLYSLCPSYCHILIFFPPKYVGTEEQRKTRTMLCVMLSKYFPASSLLSLLNSTTKHETLLYIIQTPLTMLNSSTTVMQFLHTGHRLVWNSMKYKRKPSCPHIHIYVCARY